MLTLRRRGYGAEIDPELRCAGCRAPMRLTEG